jgi:integrase
MNLPDGRVEVRTRYRDFDGKARLVSARAATKSSALAELKKRLAQRNGQVLEGRKHKLAHRVLVAPPGRRSDPALQVEVGEPVVDELVEQAVERERRLDGLVEALREIGVARCDALLKQLGRLSYARSKRAKTVLGLAVRHEVVPRNPTEGVAKLHKPKRSPTALTAAEVNAIRAVIKVWEHTRGTSGPNPDGRLGQIVEVMLGTSARIGEVLGIRRCDVTTTPATLRICGTVISQKGVGTFRHPHPTDRPLESDGGAADFHR